MSEIVLKRANVEKRVDSEDKAKALETKGFIRTDGKKATTLVSDSGMSVVTKELKNTKEQLLESEKRVQELETELSGTKEQLQESEKKVQELEIEVSGTKEQLEAAVKKNKAANGK